jgi:indole-3-glycerol phosphate synthase
MSGFLDRMATASRARLDEARAHEPLASVRARALASPPGPALRLQGTFNLIAEFKRRSPSLGRLGDDDLVTRVTAYADGGAAAVSVLTEPSQFHGNLDHLSTAAATLAPLGVPAMRKDFLVDPYQLYEARAAGASGALLIVRMLPGNLLAEMLSCARELSLFALVEVFDEHDIVRAMRVVTPGVLLGVNCRDLQTLEVLPGRFAELTGKLPQDAAWVAESGITTPDDCAEVARDGYELALVGSALMTAPEPAGVIRTMLAAGRAAT